jgi:hypothetical protein
MSLRLPRGLPGADRGGKIDALQYEVLQESAATLARLGRRAEQALGALAAFVAAGSAGGEERDRLVGAAGEALWYYVVQREVMGIGGTEQVMRDLRVPREVRLRMGVRARAAP